MDTSDPQITFDQEGHCCHCTKVADFLSRRPGLGERQEALGKKIQEMKDYRARKGNRYDCIIGLSGGVDSSYVAYLVKELGLNPLAVHMDGGWNSEIAVSNIEGIVKSLDIDLVTHVVDWEVMRKLQLSFLKAGVINADIPQDHTFVAVLLSTASKHGLRHVVSGHNMATESILPTTHQGHTSGDLWYLKDVHAKNGDGSLAGYPHYGILDLILYRGLKKIHFFNILDYYDYDKAEAKKLITEKLGWRDYGGKHFESMWTRFFQSYYLLKRFGIDKRLSHLSSLIMSGQISREEALREIENPPVSDEMARDLCLYVANKLGITLEELNGYVEAPPAVDSYKKFRGSLMDSLKTRFWTRRNQSRS